MTARGTNLNRHGATIQLTRKLLVGSIVLVRNKRGTQVTARIVAQVTAIDGLHCYGIEFLEQATSENFVGNHFSKRLAFSVLLTESNSQNCNL